MRFIAPTLCLVCCVIRRTNAFAPAVGCSSNVAARTGTTSTRLHVAPIGGPEHLPDAETICAAANQLQHYFGSSTFLADAAAATADIAEAAAKDEGGWWNSYLEFMKGGLSAVHSVIDEPLRKVGWEQTWGPSIFLFTAGKLLVGSQYWWRDFRFCNVYARIVFFLAVIYLSLYLTVFQPTSTYAIINPHLRSIHPHIQVFAVCSFQYRCNRVNHPNT